MILLFSTRFEILINERLFFIVFIVSIYFSITLDVCIYLSHYMQNAFIVVAFTYEPKQVKHVMTKNIIAPVV